MNLKVSKLTLEQLCLFFHTYRPSDLLEVYHASGKPLSQWEVDELKDTMCLYDEDTQLVFCIWGIEKGDESFSKVIWMLCTEMVEVHPISFLRYCKKYLENLQNVYPLLWNYVWLGNELHVKWLKWMGATFGETTTINGEPFQYFYFMKE